MKTLLVFPCQWYPTQPYLSGPYLVSYLRAKGWEARQRDFNIESYDYFLSPACLRQAAARLERRLGGLRARPSLTFKDKALMDVLNTGLKLAGPIGAQIDEAKKVMRTPDLFFDFNMYRQADAVIKSALKLVSDAYAPAVLSLAAFESGSRAEDSSRRVMALAKNRDANPFIDLYDEQLLPAERWEDYAVVGISVIGISQIVPGLTLAGMLKRRFPHLHIVLGGPVFSVNGGQLADHPAFFEEFCHSIIQFEGEEPLHRLLLALQKGGGLQDNPNLMYLENGVVKKTEERVELRFDEIPPPVFDDLPMERYLAPYPILPVLQSRGCYWGRCTFCTHSYIYGHRYGKQRTHAMVDELQRLGRTHNTRYFTFSDEAVAPHALKDVSDVILERQADVKALALLKFEKVMDEKLFAKMRQAGFIFLMFGLESANDRILALIEKGATRALAKDVLRHSDAAGIWNHTFLFFGFPTETRAEAMDTIRFLQENNGRIHSFGPGVFLLNRDSSVYQFPEQYAITRIVHEPEADLAMNLDFETGAGMTRAEAAEVNQLCVKAAEGLFPGIKWWGVMPREHFLLYLDRYGKERLTGQPPAPSENAPNLCLAG